MSASRQIRRKLAKAGTTQLDRVLKTVDKVQKAQSSFEGLASFSTTLKAYQESVSQTHEGLLERIEALEEALLCVISCVAIPEEARNRLHNLLKVK